MSTRPSRSVSSPPRVLRVSTCSRTATSGPPEPAIPSPGASGRAAGAAGPPGAAGRRGSGGRPPWPPPGGPCPGRCAPAGPGPRWSAAAASLSIRCSPASWFICAASSGTDAGADEVHAALGEGPHLRGGTGADPAGQQPQVLAGQVAVLLRTGQGELLGQRLGVQHEPGVRVPARGDLAQRAQGVEAGEQGRREAGAAGVQPQRRRAGQDADAVVAPDRGVVLDPLRVVPHPVQVDHPRPGLLGGLQQGAVDVVRHPGDQVARRVAPAGRPVLPHQVEVAADSAAGHDHGRCGERELPDHGVRRAYAAGQLAALEHLAGQLDAVGPRLDRRDPVPRPDPHLSGLQHPSANGSTSPGPVPQVRWKRGPSCRDRGRCTRRARPTAPAGTSARRARAATTAARRPRSARTPRPSGAARSPPAGRTRRCPASRPGPARPSPGSAAAAAPGC